MNAFMYALANWLKLSRYSHDLTQYCFQERMLLCPSVISSLLLLSGASGDLGRSFSSFATLFSDARGNRATLAGRQQSRHALCLDWQASQAPLLFFRFS